MRPRTPSTSPTRTTIRCRSFRWLWRRRSRPARFLPRRWVRRIPRPLLLRVLGRSRSPCRREPCPAGWFWIRPPGWCRGPRPPRALRRSLSPRRIVPGQTRRPTRLRLRLLLWRRRSRPARFLPRRWVRRIPRPLLLRVLGRSRSPCRREPCPAGWFWIRPPGWCRGPRPPRALRRSLSPRRIVPGQTRRPTRLRLRLLLWRRRSRPARFLPRRWVRRIPRPLLLRVLGRSRSPCRREPCPAGWFWIRPPGWCRGPRPPRALRRSLSPRRIVPGQTRRPTRLRLRLLLWRCRSRPARFLPRRWVRRIPRPLLLRVLGRSRSPCRREPCPAGWFWIRPPGWCRGPRPPRALRRSLSPRRIVPGQTRRPTRLRLRLLLWRRRSRPARFLP